MFVFLFTIAMRFLYSFFLEKGLFQKANSTHKTKSFQEPSGYSIPHNEKKKSKKSPYKCKKEPFSNNDTSQLFPLSFLLTDNWFTDKLGNCFVDNFKKFFMYTNDSLSPILPIIHIAHRFEAIAQRYIFQPTGFSPMSMNILRLLRDNGPLIASDLIRMTATTKSNMSQRLSFLEKEHLVSRMPAKENGDKRKTMISLTTSGKKKIATLEERIKKAEISFEKKFTPKELADHKAFFEKLSIILDNGECELTKIFK